MEWINEDSVLTVVPAPATACGKSCACGPKRPAAAPVPVGVLTQEARDRHPCFSNNAHHIYGRVHLPVAPACNVQCNYCNRKYDCVEESRPGVTSSVLSPRQAVAYLANVLQRRPEIVVVGIAGPADPFARPELTLETLDLVRREFPDMLLCLATNGLGLPPHLDEIARIGVSHVTVTVNAVDPVIGARIYGWVRDGIRVRRGVDAAQALLEKQLESISGLKARGVTVKINSIVLPGINDEHIPQVAERVAELGADILNCVPLYPVEDTPFATLESPSGSLMARVRKQAGTWLPLMIHCKRCRADAVGLLGEGLGSIDAEMLQAYSRMPLAPEENRPYVAVASHEGCFVNQHLGEAEAFWVFEKTDDGIRFVESRTAPERGGGDVRWVRLAEVLRDCRALLALRAGGSPRSVLEGAGVKVIETEGVLQDAVYSVFDGRKIPSPVRRGGCADGGCKGGGGGC